MSRVRSKDTNPEILVRKFLFSKGFRYKIHDKGLAGKPDIVLPKYKTVIFVHGCFWHGHEGCKYFVVPKTRTEWWQNKISTNVANDIRAAERLRQSGWDVVIVWECELKAAVRDNTLLNLHDRLLNR